MDDFIRAQIEHLNSGLPDYKEVFKFILKSKYTWLDVLWGHYPSFFCKKKLNIIQPTPKEKRIFYENLQITKIIILF